MGKAKVKVVLNKEGVRDVMLKGPGIANLCDEYASQILSRCGPGYAKDTYTGKNRVNAMVFTDSASGARDNSKNNTLLKALG